MARLTSHFRWALLLYVAITAAVALPGGVMLGLRWARDLGLLD